MALDPGLAAAIAAGPSAYAAYRATTPAVSAPTPTPVQTAPAPVSVT
ncbi:unnamed protein product, partial [marine sediment metagenome]